MKSHETLHVLAEITANQWGMVTAAQAGVQGVSRLTLSRLTEAGHLERLAHGVYKDAGAPSDQFEDLRAAWLSTDPGVMAEARLHERALSAVVASVSAASLHGIGDLWAERHEFVSPTRRQSQRAEIRHRQRSLDPSDVTLVEGLPTMTVERTIADLVEDVGERSLVADVLRDAARKQKLNLDRLRELLAPLAARNGFPKRDGAGLIHELLETAGLDADSVARRVAADATLGSRVTASYLAGLDQTDLNRLVMTPDMQESMKAIQSSIAKTLGDTLSPQLARLNASAATSVAELVRSGAFDNISQMLADQFTTESLQRLAHSWAKALSADLALEPETLSAIRSAQNSAADD